MQEGCSKFLSIPTVGVHALCLGRKCIPCVDLLPGESGEPGPSCGACIVIFAVWRSGRTSQGGAP